MLHISIRSPKAFGNIFSNVLTMHFEKEMSTWSRAGFIAILNERNPTPISITESHPNSETGTLPDLPGARSLIVDYQTYLLQALELRRD